jgi:hypothetical protein
MQRALDHVSFPPAIGKIPTNLEVSP